MAVGALFLDYRSVSADCRRRLRFLETTLAQGDDIDSALAPLEDFGVLSTANLTLNSSLDIAWCCSTFHGTTLAQLPAQRQMDGESKYVNRCK